MEYSKSEKLFGIREMVNIALIHEAPIPTWSCRQLILSFKNLGARVSYLRIQKISIEISRNNGIRIHYGLKEVETPDAQVVRSLGFALSIEQFFRRIQALKIISDLGVFTINPIESMIIARDKFYSLFKLKENNIPIPSTIVTEDVLLAMEKVKEWKEAVLKPLMGSLGYGSIKTNEADIAYNIGKAFLSINQPLYIQEYIRKPQRDIRVFVVGDKVLGSVYRISYTSWKTNVAQGAKVVKAPKIPEVEEYALKAAKALNLYYAGVDIAETPENGYVVFEVNAAPLWRGFQKATGINPADEIAKFVIEHIRR